MDKIYAPWSDRIIESANQQQWNVMNHPYTCRTGNRMDEDHRVYQRKFGGDYGQLIATKEGFKCPACSYVQSWKYGTSKDI